jgi:hypothetical protein
LKSEQQESDLAFEILNTKFIENVNDNEEINLNEFNEALYFEEIDFNKVEEELETSTLETIDLLRSAANILNKNFNHTFSELDFDPINFFDYKKNLFIETSTPFNEKDSHVNVETSPSTENLTNFNSFGFCLNDYVSVSEKKYGILKFIGNVHFKHGIFCGLELDEPEGRHDGKIDNIRLVILFSFKNVVF